MSSLFEALVSIGIVGCTFDLYLELPFTVEVTRHMACPIIYIAASNMFALTNLPGCYLSHGYMKARCRRRPHDLQQKHVLQVFPQR